MSRSALLVSLLLLSGCTEASVTPCRTVRVADLPFQIESGSLVVDASLNGAPVRLVFDTGSATSVLAEAAVERLHLKTVTNDAVELDGIGGTRHARTVVADRFELGGLRGDHFPFLAATVFREGEGGFDGLLSTDFLSKYDIDLDFPEHKIILYYPVGQCGQPFAALDQPLYTVPLIHAPLLYGEDLLNQPQDSTPDIALTIAGRPARATVDTGAAASAIFRDAAARHGLDIATLADTDLAGIDNGIGPNGVRAVRHKMAPIAVGDLTISNLPVDIVDQHSIDNSDMLLGLDFLSRVHVWISYSAHALIMQFPPKASPPR